VVDISTHLKSAYLICGIQFTYNGNTILLMKDESFPLDETGNVVFRGLATSLLGISSGDLMSSLYFNNGYPLTVLSSQSYGNQDEEKLIMFKEM